MDFRIVAPNYIVVRKDASKHLDEYIKGLGKHYLVLLDTAFYNTPVAESFKEQIEAMGAACTLMSIFPGEPTVDGVDTLYERAKEAGCDAVIAVGGGSCIDSGRMISAMLTNGGPSIDYLSYVGKSKPVVNDPVPLVTVATTSGTGSEVGMGAVLCSHEQNFKRSVPADIKMYPKVALIDPSLLLSCPKSVTAQSGLDALAHCIESYVATAHTPISDMWALQGIEFGGRSLQRAWENGSDYEAREGMALCSLCGGMALYNARNGAAHGIGMAMGIEYGLGHGLAVGIALPHVMELNAPAVPEKMDRVGEALTGRRFSTPGEGAAAAVDFVKKLNAAIEIPPDFKYLGTPREKIPYFVEAIKGNSLKANPVQLSPEGWAEFLDKII